MTVARVVCRVPNGITLRRFAPGPDDGTGAHPMVQVGSVTLAGPPALMAGAGNSSPNVTVVNEVDREWIEGWMEENRDTELVRGGHVAILDDDDPPPEAA